ncbi:MAG: branched-chain amino acid ABC transporter permease [Defluviitaleaceae bacterium]|nr:branched-chain amino acid ABC transporter permease [Defluviitaleaceae bacterium]
MTLKNLATPKNIIGIIAIIAFVVIVPQVVQGFAMTIINVALLFAIISYGVSIMLGMGGQLSFAAVTFMGFGAYFIANMSTGRLGFVIPTFLALLLTPIVFAGVAFLIGLVLLKLKGTYFTFSTIALVQVAFTYFNNFQPLFGGPDGISGIPTLTIGSYSFGNDLTAWFYLICVFVIIGGIIVERIRRSQLGRSLASIRDNETAALTLGVNTYLTKVIAFSIAGAFAAFAGALWVMHGRFVGAEMFNFLNATQFIIMAMIGGVNSTVGIVIGALLVRGLPEFFRGFQGYMNLFWGVSIILLMVFMPTGLAGIKDVIVDKFRQFRVKSRKGDDDDATNTKA